MEELALEGEERWLYFLKEARRWTALPEPLRSPELVQAMATLEDIAMKSQEYWLHHARRRGELEQRSLENAHARAVRERDSAFEERDSALEVRDAAVEALDDVRRRLEEARAALVAAGLDPDEVFGS